MARSRFMDELMNEVIRYGGLPVRRYDVYRDALARTGNDQAAQRFAFLPRAIEGVEPISREELEAL
jgi:hypothetical protein